MSDFLILPGPQALSKFRVSNLVQELEKNLNQHGVIASVLSAYTHYVSLKEDLTPAQLQLTQILLTYDSPVDVAVEANKTLQELVVVSGDEQGAELKFLALNKSTVLVRVLPRPGTISPWSSKATDIANIVGLGDKIERIERGISLLISATEGFDLLQALSSRGGEILTSVYDRMTQLLYINGNAPKHDDLFAHHEPKPLVTVDITSSPENLAKANVELGLALDKGEVDYLINAFTKIIGRNPTDVELFMFAQVNSEHCRHKIFNADWTIDGVKKDLSLFKMIRNTT